MGEKEQNWKEKQHTSTVVPTSALSLRLISCKESICRVDSSQAVFSHVIPVDPSSYGTQLAQGSPWSPNKALMSPDSSASGEAHVLLQGQEGWTLATEGRLVRTLSPIFPLLLSSWKAAWNRIVLLPSIWATMRDELSSCKSVWTQIWDTKLQTSFTSRLKHCPRNAGGPWPHGWDMQGKGLGLDSRAWGSYSPSMEIPMQMLDYWLCVLTYILGYIYA